MKEFAVSAANSILNSSLDNALIYNVRFVEYIEQWCVHYGQDFIESELRGAMRVFFTGVRGSLKTGEYKGAKDGETCAKKRKTDDTGTAKAKPVNVAGNEQKGREKEKFSYKAADESSDTETD